VGATLLEPELCNNATRVHFFRSPVDISGILTAVDVIDDLKRSGDETLYVGFATLRPIRICPIGATILKPRAGDFVTCRDSFEVHIAGCTFSVEGTPFMQQDNAVGTCAETSIWTALRTMYRKDGMESLSPAEITISASQSPMVMGRTLPNREGLSLVQIVDVIKKAGYSSHVIKMPESAEDRELALAKIHCYIESSIPVILVLNDSSGSSDHAVAAVGHGPIRNKRDFVKAGATFDIQLNGTVDGKLKIFDAARCIDSLIVQNDSRGPYQNLSRIKGEKGSYSIQDIRYMVPLLPKDVFMSAEEAWYSATTLLRQMWPRELLPSMGPVIMRLYLCERHEFRSWARENNELSKTVSRLYRNILLPRKVWVVELSYENDYCVCSAAGGTRVGEIVLDATGDSSELPFLLSHFNLNRVVGKSGQGVVFIRHVDVDTGDESFEVEHIGDENDYCPVRRG